MTSNDKNLFILSKADFEAIDRVSYIKSETVDNIITKYKGQCSKEEWQWINLLKKATDNFWKAYNEGIKHNKLFLEEELKSFCAFEALGKNIPDKFIKELYAR